MIKKVSNHSLENEIKNKKKKGGLWAELKEERKKCRGKC